MMAPAAPQKKRNVAMIIVGILLIVIALLPTAVFFYNLWQYSTVDDRWGSYTDIDPEARAFATDIIKDAALHRMMIFGPVSALFWLVGLILGGLGLRKK